MKKKGFTLVELLAVIAILAILVIIAMPNVLNMFNKAKQDSFETEVKTIIKTTEKQWISDSMGKPGVNETIYCRVDGVDCENSLKMDGNDKTDYYVKVDSQGNIVELGATNNEYQFSSNKKGLKADDEISSDVVSDLDKDDILKITSSGVVITSKNTIYNKKYLLSSGQGTYVIISNDNVLSVYDINDNLISKHNPVINNNLITLNDADVYNGTYKISNDYHNIIVENVGDIDKGYIVLYEDGYCTHDVPNSSGGTWISLELDKNKKPLLVCNTCGKHSYDYKLIDGVLYTKDIYVGDYIYVADTEYNPYYFPGYNVLIWDKTLDTINIKKEIDGVKVNFYNGHQMYTDKNNLNATTWNFEGTKAEWNNIKNNYYGYSYAYPGLKVICTDGTIQY